MKIAFTFFLLLLTSCSAKEEDTSPFDDVNRTIKEPVYDLLHSVFVYKEIHKSFPPNFKELTELTAKDWLSVNEFKMMSSDTVIIGNLEPFSLEYSTINYSPNGIEVIYSFKNNAVYYSLYEEALFSKDFDTHIFTEYHTTLIINNGNGTIKIDTLSGKATVNFEMLDVIVYPTSGGESSEFRVINNSEVIDIQNYAY